MAGVGFQVVVQGLERLRALNEQSVKRGIRTAMQIAVSEVTRSAKLAAPVRSGRLRASIKGRLESQGFVGVVGTDVIYGRIQELGGEVKARNVKFLTIPLPAAQTAAGITRRGARDFPNTFVIRSRRGTPIIMQRLGGEAIPLFVLKQQVTIPQKRYLTKALQQNRNRIRELFGEQIVAQLHPEGGSSSTTLESA